MATVDAEQINRAMHGFDRLFGMEFLSCSDTEVRAQVTVRDELKQPAGLLHGGVYASMAESMASFGTALGVFEQGDQAMGLSNNTSFLRPVTEGVVHACDARAPRAHDLGVGRALQRRCRAHVRGDAHDDRGAPCPRRRPAAVARLSARARSERVEDRATRAGVAAGAPASAAAFRRSRCSRAQGPAALRASRAG
jgi:uncharacterized protein (TIGR00369 family)